MTSNVSEVYRSDIRCRNTGPQASVAAYGRRYSRRPAGQSERIRLLRVFVTGATEFIGTPLVRELLDDGTRCSAWRAPTMALPKLTVAGATVYCGDLPDPGSLS